MYLSEEEKSIKEKIEESLWEFFRLHDQLNQNKIKIDQWNVAIIFKRFAAKSTNTATNSKRENWRNLFAKWLTKSKRSRDNIRRQIAIWQQFQQQQQLVSKSFDARNARLENEKLRDPNNVNRRHHRQIEQKQEANVAVLKNTNSTKWTFANKSIWASIVLECSTFFLWSFKV